MLKKNLLIVFGGKSTEHEVSRTSAGMILDNIDKGKYNIFVLGITKEGKWLICENYNSAKVKDGTWEQEGKEAYILPNNTKSLLVLENEGTKVFKIDVVFNIIHGNTGEDGKIQGLLELAGIPYVGCNTISSAICMDKAFTKIIVNTINIPQAKYIVVKDTYDLEVIEKKTGYPCFIKPANSGSSIGISKAKNRKELIEGINTAFKYDEKVLIEEGIEGIEVECAVLGNEDPIISTVGEITYNAEFYDYETKYISDDSKAIIPTNLEESTIKKIREYTKEIYKILDCKGLSRLDFFVEKGTNDVVFNEINTLPGFTPISMYPMLMEHEGISKTELIDRLIELSLERRD
ncbi:MAG TPA: D-alanine--D-alanine ligase A [Clostridiales bacterium]|nr:MAG: D-alanine--D-alanine ligase A [Clostridiales bacterium GWD2_32_19]HCC07366.1 D-alanine--D-alanine ligase A [Clostridiales bacterium]